jgi:hypothetical protein
MEIERENAELKLSEMRARFIKIARRTLISFLIAVTINVIQSPKATLGRILIFTTGFSIIVNFHLGLEVISNWRDLMKARRELRSWNDVMTDYNNKIKEAGPLESHAAGPDP